MSENRSLTEAAFEGLAVPSDSSSAYDPLPGTSFVGKLDLSVLSEPTKIYSHQSSHSFSVEQEYSNYKLQVKVECTGCDSLDKLDVLRQELLDAYLVESDGTYVLSNVIKTIYSLFSAKEFGYQRLEITASIIQGKSKISTRSTWSLFNHG